MLRRLTLLVSYWLLTDLKRRLWQLEMSIDDLAREVSDQRPRETWWN